MSQAGEQEQTGKPAFASSELTLGGDNPATDYHPLALDVGTDGFWGNVDRISRRVGEWLNPILVKEARQSLKSRQFVITFFLLLLASCLWTLLGVLVNAPDVYYVPRGTELLIGYYFVLAIPLIGMVPLAAHRSLAAEIDEDTFEMLVMTRLSSTRIVMGKLNSAMLQMMVYFAAIVPCLAFTYLLRGVSVVTIAMLVVLVFFTALLVTSIALLLAAVAANRAMQTLALLAVLGIIIFAEFMCGIFCLDGVLNARAGSFTDMLQLTLAFLTIGATCMWLFLKAAAARIAPVTENRSSGLRWCMFVQQLVWIAVITALALSFEEREAINFGSMVVAGYWLVMGTLMLAESPELSPRVLRSLPSTYAGRAVLTWFNPGPGSGFVFSIASGVVGIFAFSVFGEIDMIEHASSTSTFVFGCIMAGYLMGYLGLVRLVAMPLCHRFGRIFPIPIGVLVSVMGLALITPTLLSVVMTGAPPTQYTPLEAFNWGWTVIKAFDSIYDPLLAMTILVVGAAIALVNLLFMVREMRYRRIAVPHRVLEDQQQAVRE